MTQLASVDDLTSRLGRDLTTAENERASAILDDVSAAVVAYTGQQFVADEHAVRLPVRRNKVRLPQRPVTDVASVVDVYGNDITFTWDAGSTIYLDPSVPDSWAWEPRRTALTYVDVTYTAGFDAVPADIIAVVCQIAARSFGRSPDLSGVTSESLGDASQSYGVIAAAGPLGLMPEEREVLDRYRRAVGTINVSP